MFGANEITGRKFFADAEDRLMVTSQFFTLQGEGPYSGMPAVFLRLSKCNLACGFCDTHFDAGTYKTLEEIADEEARLLSEFFGPTPPAWARLEWGRGSRWEKGERRDYVFPVEPLPIVYVITGGEPTLQMLRPLIESRQRYYAHVQIESNGLIAQDLPLHTTLVLSPKAVGNPLHYSPPNAKMLEQASCLKFVLDANIEPYNGVPGWALDWRAQTGKEVYVSPMNHYARQPTVGCERVSFWEPGLLDLPRNQANHEYAADYAMRYGLRLSIQQHLYASLP